MVMSICLPGILQVGDVGEQKPLALSVISGNVAGR